MFEMVDMTLIDNEEQRIIGILSKQFNREVEDIQFADAIKREDWEETDRLCKIIGVRTWDDFWETRILRISN